MPFIPVPNTLQMNIRATVNTIPMENVFHLKRVDDGVWDLPTIQATAATAVLAWRTFMLPNLCTGYLATTVYCRELSTEAGLVWEEAFLPTDAGSAAGEALPGSVAACITHRTGLAGRSYRGRTYISGISELSVLANNLVAGYALDLITDFIAFKNDVIDTDAVFVVASRFHNNAPRVTGIATRITSSTLRDTRVDTQRRRLS